MRGLGSSAPAPAPCAFEGRHPPYRPGEISSSWHNAAGPPHLPSCIFAKSCGCADPRALSCSDPRVAQAPLVSQVPSQNYRITARSASMGWPSPSASLSPPGVLRHGRARATGKGCPRTALTLASARARPSHCPARTAQVVAAPATGSTVSCKVSSSRLGGGLRSRPHRALSRLGGAAVAPGWDRSGVPATGGRNTRVSCLWEQDLIPPCIGPMQVQVRPSLRTLAARPSLAMQGQGAATMYQIPGVASAATTTPAPAEPRVQPTRGPRRAARKDPKTATPPAQPKPSWTWSKTASRSPWA